MFSKKTTCGVCGLRFTPTKKDVYTAQEPRSMAECFSKPPTTFSVMDCPRCGCQVTLAVRVPRALNFETMLKREGTSGAEAAESPRPCRACGTTLPLIKKVENFVESKIHKCRGTIVKEYAVVCRNPDCIKADSTDYAVSEEEAVRKWNASEGGGAEK